MLTLRELGNLLKGNRSFWFKRAMAAAVPGTAYLLYSSPSFPVRLTAGVVFLFAGPMTASWFLVSSFVEPVIFTVKFRKASPRTDEDLLEILKRSGVKARRHTLRLVKGMDNAFTNVFSRTVSYGDLLYNRQTREERQVTMAHEVGHITSPFLTIRSAGLFGAAMLMMLLVTPVVHDSFMTDVILMSVMYLIIVPLHWDAEYAADQHACKLYGPERVIATLERLVPSDKFGLDSDSHPSINRRIRRIRK